MLQLKRKFLVHIEMYTIVVGNSESHNKVTKEVCPKYVTKSSNKDKIENNDNIYYKREKHRRLIICTWTCDD